MFMTNDPQVQRMTITPERAQTWLTNNSNNRKIKKKHVDRLARDMSRGKWFLTTNGITFDKHGILIDGQHRLSAIVKSGVSIEMFVWRNANPDIKSVMDCGRGRSMSEVLSVGGNNGKVTNDHINLLMAMLGGLSRAEPLTPSETSEALAQYQEAIEFAMENLPKTSMARNINTATTRAVVARAYYHVNKDKLKEFCNKLTTGIGCSEKESLIVIFRRMLQAPWGNKPVPRLERYAKMEKVLATWLDNKDLKGIHPVKDEQFPLPEKCFCCAN